MRRILITSGPTRQFIDPVRFISNASSGQMGLAMSRAALRAGYAVTLVSGPVGVKYPAAARLIQVETTEEMLAACQREFPRCVGLIGVAAPCDYRPEKVATQKIAKTGQPLMIRLVETPDIVATLGHHKRPQQWTVGFALETNDARFRALAKLQRKSCDLVVVNEASAIGASSSCIEVLNPSGEVVAAQCGSKTQLATRIIQVIEDLLVKPRRQSRKK